VTNPRNDARPTSRGALVLAGVVSLVVGSVVPFGGVLLYPFTLLATWVHEMGHGVTALALGGGFDRLEIFADAAGLAHTTGTAEGWPRGLVALGGLVSPAIAGAVVLAGARGARRAQVVLAVLSLALLLSLVVWVRSLAGCIAVPLVAFALLGVAVWGSPRERLFLAQFVGLRLAGDTLGRGLSYAFADAAIIDGTRRPSDIAAVAAGFGGPRLGWSLVVAVVCIAFVGVGLFAAWRRPRQRLRSARLPPA